MENPEVIYNYLLQYTDCSDNSDEAIEISNNALYELMDLLDDARDKNIFSTKDIPALFDIVLKIELELEDESSYNIEWSIKDQILELILNLICIDGVLVWGDTLSQTINKYRNVNREYIKFAVNKILSFFLFGKTSEYEKTAIENRIAFLKALQKNIPDYKELLISYCNDYIEEWAENNNITKDDRKKLEAIAKKTNWNQDQFCLYFYNSETDKNNDLLNAVLRLNLHIYHLYTFLIEHEKEEIDFGKVQFILE